MPGMQADPADRHPTDMNDWEWESTHPSDMEETFDGKATETRDRRHLKKRDHR